MSPLAFVWSMLEHTRARRAFKVVSSLIAAWITFKPQTLKKWEMHEMLTSPGEQ